MRKLNGLHAKLMEESKKLVDEESLAKLASLHQHLEGAQVSVQEQTDSVKGDGEEVERKRSKEQKHVSIQSNENSFQNNNSNPHSNQLNLQKTLMELQKQYLDYELQKAQQEFQVLDIFQIEDDFARSFELQNIVSDSSNQTKQQRKKKSEFIDLLQKCRICSDSDLNYATKPFKLVKKLKDVRIMFERKSNNLEQQMKKNNMNKNKIIEDIKADKVVIRKTLPEQAKYYLSEIEKDRQVKTKYSKLEATHRSALNTTMSNCEAKSQSTFQINNLSINPPNSNSVIPKLLSKIIHRKQPSSPTSKFEEKNARYIPKLKKRPSLILEQTGNSSVDRNQNSSALRNCNSFSNHNGKQYLQQLTNQNAINLLPVQNSPNQQIQTKNYFNRSTNSNKNNASQIYFSQQQSQIPSSTDLSSKQRIQRLSNVNQLINGFLLNRKSSKQKNFLNITPNENNNGISENPSLEKMQYLLYLKSLKSSQNESSTASNSVGLSMRRSLLGEQEIQNESKAKFSQKQQQQSSLSIDRQTISQFNSISSPTNYFSKNINPIKSMKSTISSTSDLRNKLLFDKFKDKFSSSKQFKSGQQSPSFLDKIPLNQTQRLIHGFSNKFNVPARVYDAQIKKIAPKQDILANVYNFEEDDYFKHQQVYKYEQEKAKISQIKRNVTKNQAGKKRKSQIDQNEEYFHDQYSSNDDSIPSATEAQLENCYEESIKLQKKVLETDKSDLPSKIKGLLRIETVNNEIKQLMNWITKK